MKLLVIESWFVLAYLDFTMQFRGFRALHRLVREARLRTPHSCTSGHVCHAVDLACVFYFKPVLCLQRSAATTMLLRRHGWHAEMVIGTQMIPFRSHAWVELKGVIVNDRPYLLDSYKVLERC
jgi:Transglutaminase-like superfamily